ncbi:MAG: GNAT family N-acetyltransferase [Oscillospiraceae bacterium]|nr:GNAT family N-acetyltransferase [Oscillospiraceae bacterium]
MVFFKELETDRLFLKNISTDDKDFIFKMFSDEKVTQYLLDNEPLTDIKGADEIINLFTQSEPRNLHRWILVRKSDNEKIGTCGFHCWDKQAGYCDIGYDLSPEFWGKGYMSEAIQAILDFAKNEMKVSKINACVYPENNKSVILLEKHGFIFNGQMKDEIFRGKKYLHKIYVLSYVK